MPFRVNPYERRQLMWLQQNANRTPEGAGMFFDILGGAQDRFAQQKATRQQGMSQLQQLAMELAGGTASEDAVLAAVTGQAEDLPLMRGQPGERRIGALEDFVGGLYGEGPVSGLAPADVRAQFNAGTAAFDQEDLAAIGSAVAQGYQQGVPFRDIREQIRVQLLSAGLDEPTVMQGVGQAESIYEQLIGQPLSELRATGEQLRSLQNDPRGIDLSYYLGERAMNPGQEQMAQQIGNQASAGTLDSTGLLGRYASQGQLGQLQELLNNQAPTAEDEGFWGLMHPSNWFFQG